MTKEKIDKDYDFELLSGLLTCIMPIQFAEQSADCLLKKYGTFSNVISQPLDELLSTVLRIKLGIDDDVDLFLRVIYETSRRIHSVK